MRLILGLLDLLFMHGPLSMKPLMAKELPCIMMYRAPARE
jgi:hypothetical protein